VCYLYHASPDTDPSDALGRVGLFPAERSGIGLALMAAEDARTWPPRLAPTLRQVRRRGYALVRPAGQGAIRSLGVAIDSPPSAAVAVSGDFPNRRLPELLDAVRETAAAIAGQTERNER
jgi:DNA-binding IclR family transcriptional regulator